VLVLQCIFTYSEVSSCVQEKQRASSCYPFVCPISSEDTSVATSFLYKAR